MNIWTYNKASKGAAALAVGLKAKRIKHKDSRFRGRPDKVVLNWGGTEVSDEVAKCRIINEPSAVRVASAVYVVNLQNFWVVFFAATTPWAAVGVHSLFA